MAKKKKKNKIIKLNFSRRRNVIFMVFALAFAFVGATYLYYTYAAPASNYIVFDQAKAKPTDWGRQINDLHVFDGKVFAGYGDWNANGRINVQIYDPATGEITVGPQMGNALHYMYDDGNTLYAVGPESGGVYKLNKGADPVSGWQRSGCCTHEFGVITTNGETYVSGQSSSNDGVVGKLSADGTTLTTVLDGGTDSFRFHGIATIPSKNQLWVFGQGDDWVMNLTTKVWEPRQNTVWYDMMYKATTFNDRIIGLKWYPTGGTNHGPLLVFDGERVVSQIPGIDYAIDGEYIYVLDASGVVKRSTNLSNWQQVASVKGGGKTTVARSIEVLGDKIYVGATEGRMFILDMGGGGGSNGKGRNK